MARYAIGDVQGCYDTLMHLLEKLDFDEQKDELWFAGDLVNRGPNSLLTLRYINALGKQGGFPARVVLGNHDLHLLACFHSRKQPKKKDTFGDIFSAPDADELLHWLAQQPLMHWDKAANIVMTHAGIPHIWSTEQAYQLNTELVSAIRSHHTGGFFEQMYGNDPACWDDALTGFTRFRVITNYFTRMRFIKPSGELDFSAKEDMGSAPQGYAPWFSFPAKDDTCFIFGHWAALTGHTGFEPQFQAIDTGCVWGGQLTALNLDSFQRHACQSQERQV